MYMHYLHKILVYIPDAIDVEEETSKNEVLSAIKAHAVSETENYYGDAFDWRSEDAGRWADVYPQQTYIAADNVDWFIQELEGAISSQQFEINSNLSALTEEFGSDLNKIVEYLWTMNICEPGTDPASFRKSLGGFFLHNLAELLSGYYRYNSCFYNTNRGSARLFESDIAVIKEDPKNWALVMLDYHY